MSAVVSIVPVPSPQPYNGPRFPHLSASERRQCHEAPKPWRKALYEVLRHAAIDIVRVDRTERLAVVVYEPTIRTVLALRTVLRFVDLFVVLGMALQLVGARRRVFGCTGPIADVAMDRVRHTLREQATALVFAGHDDRPMIARVPRAKRCLGARWVSR